MYEASAWANYPGRPNHSLQLYVRGDASSGNSSRYAWQLIARRDNGAVSWNYDQMGYSVNIGGQIWNGSASLPFSSSQNTVVLASGVTDWKGHDGNGNMTFYFSGNHGGGQFGVAQTGNTRFDADRLAQVPAAPYNLSVGTVWENNFEVRYARGDNRGDGIRRDHAEWSRERDGAVVWNDYGPNGYTSPNFGNSPGAPILEPFTTYRVRIRSENGIGWGPWSGTITARTIQAPPAPRLTSAAPGALRVDWEYPGSNFIRDPIGYTVQVSGRSDFATWETFDTSVTYAWAKDGGYSPGAQLWVRVRARYADVVGPWSPASAITLLSGVYASDGDEWEGAGTFASNGVSFAAARVLYSTGADWLDAK